MSYAFDPSSIDQLPDVIAVFPLPGATLLPRTQLPLNIFEPRYLSMVFDALAGHRCIGMVQPNAQDSDDAKALFSVGCLGRITAYNETEDGRLLIGLHGVCRFRIAEELSMEKGYRRVRAEWGEFAGDLSEDCRLCLDRAGFKAAMSGYFEDSAIRVDWEGLDKMPDERVVNFLSMHLPLAASEKQALLEASDVEARYRVLMTITSIAKASDSEAPSASRH